MELKKVAKKKQGAVKGGATIRYKPHTISAEELKAYNKTFDDELEQGIYPVNKKKASDWAKKVAKIKTDKERGINPFLLSKNSAYRNAEEKRILKASGVDPETGDIINVNKANAWANKKAKEEATSERKQKATNAANIKATKKKETLAKKYPPWDPNKIFTDKVTKETYKLGPMYDYESVSDPKAIADRVKYKEVIENEEKKNDPGYKYKPELGWKTSINSARHMVNISLGQVRLKGKHLLGDEWNLPKLRSRTPSYLNVSVGTSQYLHRLIFGEAWGVKKSHMPKKWVVDHRDRNKYNNSISNLQMISVPENMANRAFMPKEFKIDPDDRIEDLEDSLYDCDRKLVYCNSNLGQKEATINNNCIKDTKQNQKIKKNAIKEHDKIRSDHEKNKARKKWLRYTYA